MQEVHDRARKLMQGFCRVCTVCDGRACAGAVPGMGGLGTASSFTSNVKALAGKRVNMRVLHDAEVKLAEERSKGLIKQIGADAPDEPNRRN